MNPYSAETRENVEPLPCVSNPKFCLKIPFSAEDRDIIIPKAYPHSYGTLGGKSVTAPYAKRLSILYLPTID